ncbi:DUF2939 domain-containing protein [Psychrobacter sp. HD31]|uniref:DUF2939 domain-containing protein n=1 Tax=Psychrobacter sp. HD31 TaxID=3112003 RepID=UPI003DA47383
MKKFLFLILLIAVGVFFGSPFYSLYQLKAAYDNQDGQVIADAIDYSQLTDNLKNQLNTNFQNTVDEYPMIAQFGGDKVLAKGQKFIEQAVEGAITPQNIAATISSQGQQANQSTKELAAIWAVVGGKINMGELVQGILLRGGNIEKALTKQMTKLVEAQSQEVAMQAQTGNDSDLPSFSYCGINCFNVSGDVKGYPLTVQMQRQGLIDWKIIDIKLP